MDYMNFIGVVIDRTAAQLDLSPIPTPAPSAAACCHSWSRRSAVASYLTCAQCRELHLSPARLHALIAWAGMPGVLRPWSRRPARGRTRAGPG